MVEMNPLLGYACALGGVFLLAISWRVLKIIRKANRPLTNLLARQLTYNMVLGRWRGFGPWTWAALVRKSLYLAVNVFLLAFQTKGLRDAGTKAGTLSTINMVPLYFSVHHSAMADYLGWSLSTYRIVHNEAALMTVTMSTFHVAVAIFTHSSFSWTRMRDVCGSITIFAHASLLLLSMPLIRRRAYEVFLRLHQVLSIASLYALLQHIPRQQGLAWDCVIACGCFTSGTFVLQVLITLLRNRLLFRGWARASFTYEGNVVCMDIVAPAQWKLQCGQYVNVWVPGLGFRSFLQSHPFIVTSADRNETSTKMRLLIWERRGWTARLRSRALDVDRRASSSYRVILSGPHGMPVAMQDYGIVVLVAGGSGIVAQLPFLQHLVRSYDNLVCCTRRVHLVWQLNHLADGEMALNFFNSALNDDAVKQGYILELSIYYQQGNLQEEVVQLGSHKRITFHQGEAAWEDVLTAEASHMQRNTVDTASMGGSAFIHDECQTLITVSASAEVRTRLSRVVRDMSSNVVLRELDYQPEDS